MKFTAKQAAEAVGKSLPTVSRAIKDGRLSAEGPKGGPYSIDAAELFRLWPVKVEVTPQPSPDEPPLQPEGLQVEIKMLREMLAREQDTVADLRERLTAEAEERRRITALLTHTPPQASAEDRKGLWDAFWARLKGGKAAG